MNRKQLVAMWIGIACAACLLLTPPMTGGDLVGFNRDTRSLITTPYVINAPILLARLGVIALVTSGLIVTLKDRR